MFNFFKNYTLFINLTSLSFIKNLKIKYLPEHCLGEYLNRLLKIQFLQSHLQQQYNQAKHVHQLVRSQLMHLRLL